MQSSSIESSDKYRPRFPNREVTIEIDAEVFQKLLAEYKFDESKVKKALSADVDFIYNHFRQLANHGG